MQTERIKPKTVFRITGIALAAFIVVSQGLVAAVNAIMTGNASFTAFFHEHQILYLLINYACIYGIGFLIYWLITRKLPHALPGEQTFSFKELFSFFCIGYAFAICSNFIGTIISLFSGNQTNISSEISDLVGAGGIAAWVIMIIVAPVVEELIFRKIIIDRTAKYGEKYAIVFSAVCFGLFHMNLQQFIYAASIGMVFGYVYSKSGKIHYTIIMHSLINAIGYMITMLAQPILEAMDDITLSDLLEGGSLPADLNPASMILLWIVEQAVLVIIAFGVVFFIRMLIRKIRFDYSSAECLGKKDVFRTVYLNIGFIIFAILCIAGMVISFLGGLEKIIGS